MNVLLSIKPEFAEKILNGEKRYEFRKQGFKSPDSIDTILLYASTPSQKIVGHFTAGKVAESHPEELWNQFGSESGLGKERFMSYFAGTDSGCAIEVRDPTRFSTAIDPHQHVDEFRPPVSFKYVDGDLDTLLQDAMMSVS